MWRAKTAGDWPWIGHYLRMHRPLGSRSRAPIEGGDTYVYPNHLTFPAHQGIRKKVNRSYLTYPTFFFGCVVVVVVVTIHPCVCKHVPANWAHDIESFAHMVCKGAADRWAGERGWV